MTQPPMTEKQLSATIIHAAKECGWLIARTWLSKFSPAGEPDLRMIRQGRLVVVELKSAKGKPSEAQNEWLEAYAGCGIDAFIWRPSDLEDAYRYLVDPTITHSFSRV